MNLADDRFKAERKLKIQALRDVVIALNLEAKPLFFDCCDSRLAEIYNGIGPQKFDAFGVFDLSERAQEVLGLATREALTKILKCYEPAALVHDWDCHYLPKTDAGFEEASDRFKRNCERIGRTLADAELEASPPAWWRRWLFAEGWVRETAIKYKYSALASIMYRAVHCETGKTAFLQG